MPVVPDLARQDLSPSELKQIMDVSLTGHPFVFWRVGVDVVLLTLEDRRSVSVGRRSSNDISLVGDPEASRAHARLERIGTDWVVVDDGISRNGSFVNGKRVAKAVRLVDGDRILFGSTVVEFRNPSQGESATTNVSIVAVRTDAVTDTQRRVLDALCRPYATADRHATPASNAQVAAEVFLGLDAVKAHLRDLYRLFDIDLPQNQKRAKLAELAMQLGLVDFRGR